MFKKLCYHIIKIFILWMIGFFLYCTVDHGLAPLPGLLRARVIFRNEAPGNTQGIYLTVSPQFPPHAINEMFHSPNSLPIDQDTVISEMALPFGDYEAIALWWYSTETESNLADILGLPLDINNNLLPLGFTLSKSKPVYEIDLYANWDRVRRDASIQGTVHFSGPFPENTLATAIAAYQFEPESDVHYLIWLNAMDFSIGPTSIHYNSTSFTYQYNLPVRHGRLEYIAVFWLPERSTLTDFHVLGVYGTPLSINKNDHLEGIDIFADWSSTVSGTEQ